MFWCNLLLCKIKNDNKDSKLIYCWRQRLGFNTSMESENLQINAPPPPSTTIIYYLFCAFSLLKHCDGNCSPDLLTPWNIMWYDLKTRWICWIILMFLPTEGSEWIIFILGPTCQFGKLWSTNRWEMWDDCTAYF